MVILRTICLINYTRYPHTGGLAKNEKNHEKKHSQLSSILKSGITNPEDIIADALAAQFEKASSFENYTQELVKHKRRLQYQLNFSEECTELYNDTFSLTKFESALSETCTSSPGPDDISYQMLTNRVYNFTEQKVLSNKMEIISMSLTCFLGNVLEKNGSKCLLWF